MPADWRRSVAGSERDFRSVVHVREAHLREQLQRTWAAEHEQVRRGEVAHVGFVIHLGYAAYAHMSALLVEAQEGYASFADSFVGVQMGEVQRQALAEMERTTADAEAELRSLVEQAALLGKLVNLGDPTGLLRSLADGVLRLPRHWARSSQLCYPISEGSDVFAVLGKSLDTRPDWLGRGKDCEPYHFGKMLLLQHAWRIENPQLRRQYALARDRVSRTVADGRLPSCTVGIRQHTSRTLGVLPEELHPGPGVNEHRLFHGTKAEWVLGILQHGLNERLCKDGLLGGAVYLAEDLGKSDQYCRPSSTVPPAVSEMLYGRSEPPTGLCYAFVCRAVCGYPVVTEDCCQRLGGGPIWANHLSRELATVGGAGERYTSARIERGGKLCRYREFVFFHGELVYPEYLIAYRRM
eukprot:TRINITY_DN65501_c0_g1_i1.p1 TRINITY_DN65501_c0_g1~~TRINITY_DN65501_c0_g1_i1.p1  ORF type:complete len:433 (+),score=109.51 TRINITY_DN65501_c0_g1_i1:71-1300(+)